MKDTTTPRLSLLSYFSIVLLTLICFLGITTLIKRSNSRRISKTEPVKELAVIETFYILKPSEKSMVIEGFKGKLIWFTSNQLSPRSFYQLRDDESHELFETVYEGIKLEIPPGAHAYALKGYGGEGFTVSITEDSISPVY